MGGAVGLSIATGGKFLNGKSEWTMMGKIIRKSVLNVFPLRYGHPLWFWVGPWWSKPSEYWEVAGTPSHVFMLVKYHDKWAAYLHWIYHMYMHVLCEKMQTNIHYHVISTTHLDQSHPWTPKKNSMTSYMVVSTKKGTLWGNNIFCAGRMISVWHCSKTTRDH